MSAAPTAISSASFALVLVAAVLVGAFLVTIPDRQLVACTRRTRRVSWSVTAAIGVFVTGTALAVAFGATQAWLALQTGWVNNAWGAAGGVISLSAVVIGAPARESLPVLVGAALIGPPLVAVADTLVLFAVDNGRTSDPSWAWIHRAEVVGSVVRARCSASCGGDRCRLRVGRTGDLARTGSGAVPQFALPYRILMLAPAAVSLVTVALWPAYTEAVARNDVDWAEHTLKRSLVYASGTASASLAVVAVGPVVWGWLDGLPRCRLGDCSWYSDSSPA